MPKENSIFIKEALRDIRSVGSMVASGKRVAHALLPSIKKSDPAKVIVELGLGTGDVTKEILKHIRPQDTFIGVETNKTFLEVCRDTIGRHKTHGTIHLERGLAQDIRKILAKHGVDTVDEIICTIPFRVLPQSETKDILRHANSVIKPGGYFHFIRYILAPENKTVYRALKNFSVVHKEVVILNFPPAEVICMQKNSV